MVSIPQSEREWSYILYDTRFRVPNIVEGSRQQAVKGSAEASSRIDRFLGLPASFFQRSAVHFATETVIQSGFRRF